MKNIFPVLPLEGLVNFKTGKLNSNAAKPAGMFPFFTCSQETFSTDTWSFDGKYVLLAGNNAAGIYPLKYFNGKFDAYQRTYVINSIDENVLVTRYVYYALRLQLELMKSISTGVATKFLTLSLLNRTQIPIPPPLTQRKIAAILSAYDDLIENNLRRIKILEEMAQNLYREWFVKFRFPGYQHVQFTDSPLGPIPKGWKVKLLGDLISEHIGGGWGNDFEDERHTEPAWVIRGTDIPNARACNLVNVPFRYHSTSNLKSRRLMPGDIVFEVSGGSKGQALGRSLYVSSELLAAFNGVSVICASFCKRIQPDSEQYASELLYLSFLDAYTSGEIEQYQVQSTGISNYKWSAYLEKVRRCVPPIALQERFCELISPLFSEIATLGRKNTILRRSRDLLLPKLISGEVDVSELDITVPAEVDV